MIRTKCLDAAAASLDLVAGVAEGFVQLGEPGTNVDAVLHGRHYLQKNKPKLSSTMLSYSVAVHHRYLKYLDCLMGGQPAMSGHLI